MSARKWTAGNAVGDWTDLCLLLWLDTAGIHRPRERDFGHSHDTAHFWHIHLLATITMTSVPYATIQRWMTIYIHTRTPISTTKSQFVSLCQWAGSNSLCDLEDHAIFSHKHTHTHFFFFFFSVFILSYGYLSFLELCFCLACFTYSMRSMTLWGQSHCINRNSFFIIS